MSLYEVIGTNNPTYLLADPQGADKMAIPCKPGNGVIGRGTVMYRGADGMWLPASAAEAVDTNMLAVLDETVDTDQNATITAEQFGEDGLMLQKGKKGFRRLILK